MRIHRLLLLPILLHFQVAGLQAQSKAHTDSRFAIVDPSYSAIRSLPPSTAVPDKRATWIYGPASSTTIVPVPPVVKALQTRPPHLPNGTSKKPVSARYSSVNH